MPGTAQDGNKHTPFLQTQVKDRSELLPEMPRLGCLRELSGNVQHKHLGVRGQNANPFNVL